MAKHDDGGPAFPLWHHGIDDGRQWPCGGMSLLDWYAGQATDADVEYWQKATEPRCSREAATFLHAEHMIAEKRRLEQAAGDESDKGD